MSKLNVYFNEYNIMSDNSVYFPLVSGLLQAYSQKNPELTKKYDFQPFLFVRDSLENILNQYDNPDIAAFSASMWNMNLSLNVAENIKKRFPNCLNIFGGPQVPFEAEEFFKKYPFIDVTVRGEGEKTFEELLLRFPDKNLFREIAGISFLDENRNYVRNFEREPEKNLDNFPSPYLEGIFEEIIKLNPDIKFQSIIETNRGCPYSCSYCSWGQGGLNKKFRFFSLERIKETADWCGDKKIDYVFCADSNFGMFKRDLDIAKFFVESKIKNRGYPEKFRVCYAKNAEDTVFDIGKLLHSHDMEKGITLSRQSNNPEVLINVGRKNIKMSVFNHLQKKYNLEKIPTYTELILGLPGESYESFAEGLEEMLQSGIQNQLFVYPCQVYPNTELADKDYQEKFGIKTRCIPINETHGTVRPLKLITEYEEVIVSTKAMSQDDWKKATILSTTMQLFHGLKIGSYLMNYLADTHEIKYINFLEYIVERAMKLDGRFSLKEQINHFSKSAESVLNGNSRCRIIPDFGNIYWEQEEAGFLEIALDKEIFYSDLHCITKQFLKNRGLNFNEEELKEVINYQKARIPCYGSIKDKEFRFNFNIPEYFENLSIGKKIGIKRIPHIMKIGDCQEYNDKKEFATNIVLRGRKSNKILYPIEWARLE